MRPVNLIPPEDRRGDHAPLRAGSLSYIIVGAIAAGLLAVVALVLTQNSITEHENEIAELEVARDAATQKAQALAPYAEFASLQEQRELTITTLAQSRFDWERVLRELAIVIPADVSLTSLEATVARRGHRIPAPLRSAGRPTLVMIGLRPRPRRGRDVRRRARGHRRRDPRRARQLDDGAGVGRPGRRGARRVQRSGPEDDVRPQGRVRRLRRPPLRPLQPRPSHTAAADAAQPAGRRGHELARGAGR